MKPAVAVSAKHDKPRLLVLELWGLGDLAIRYGYQRFETEVMVAVVIVLIVLVCGIQWVGDRLVARLDHRG